MCSIIATAQIRSSAQNDSGKKPEITELQKLKIENLKLKTQVASLQATVQDRENRLISIELTSEQQDLLKELRSQLDAKETDVFDWEKLVFNPPPDPTSSDKK